MPRNSGPWREVATPSRTPFQESWSLLILQPVSLTDPSSPSAFQPGRRPLPRPSIGLTSNSAESDRPWRHHRVKEFNESRLPIESASKPCTAMMSDVARRMAPEASVPRLYTSALTMSLPHSPPLVTPQTHSTQAPRSRTSPAARSRDATPSSSPPGTRPRTSDRRGSESRRRPASRRRPPSRAGGPTTAGGTGLSRCRRTSRCARR